MSREYFQREDSLTDQKKHLIDVLRCRSIANRAAAKARSGERRADDAERKGQRGIARLAGAVAAKHRSEAKFFRDLGRSYLNGARAKKPYTDS